MQPDLKPGPDEGDILLPRSRPFWQNDERNFLPFMRRERDFWDWLNVRAGLQLQLSKNARFDSLGQQTQPASHSLHSTPNVEMIRLRPHWRTRHAHELHGGLRPVHIGQRDLPEELPSFVRLESALRWFRFDRISLGSPQTKAATGRRQLTGLRGCHRLRL